MDEKKNVNALSDDKLEKVSGGRSLQPEQSDSLTRLQEGLHINRSADDAAGLSISEKMRGQLPGMDAAATNSQDGIALVDPYPERGEKPVDNPLEDLAKSLSEG